MINSKLFFKTRSRATVFSLGKRQNLLSVDLMAPLIVPHAAQQANERVSANLQISNSSSLVSI